MSTQFDREQVGFRFVEIMHGDTLQLLSLRHLGDASRWVELIDFNQLVPPFIVNDPAEARPGVLVAGDLLLVPAAAASRAAVSSPDDILRTDVLLDRGALQFSNGDFKTVSGLDNLKQGLRHALETDRGDLMFHPQYGSLIRQLIGAVNGPTRLVLAAEYGRGPVAADSRIVRVVSAKAEASGDVISITIIAESELGKLFNVEATI